MKERGIIAEATVFILIAACGNALAGTNPELC
jgi:hypothetical protein